VLLRQVCWSSSSGCERAVYEGGHPSIALASLRPPPLESWVRRCRLAWAMGDPGLCQGGERVQLHPSWHGLMDPSL
jgi:hypothetical protein